MAYTGEQKRAYQRQWKNQRRLDWIKAQGGKCVKCGSTQNIEIDHIDPSTKSYPISIIWSWGEDRREAELVKCQLLCADCHLSKTIQESTKAFEHGRYGYSKGCRCRPCKDGQAAALRDYRGRKAKA